MSVINQSIQEIRRHGYAIDQAFVGLSSQDYLHSKRPQQELNFNQRQELTQAAIDDAQDIGMFENVNISLLPNSEGPGGHEAVYRMLVQQEESNHMRPRTVILAAGGDLARNMRNWRSGSVGFATIVERAGASEMPETLPNLTRWRVEADARYIAVSSTAIRNGDLSGLGRRGQQIWRSIFPQQLAA